MKKNRVKVHLVQAKQHAVEGNRDLALDSVKKALALDPGEISITEILLSMERDETGHVQQEDNDLSETTFQQTLNVNIIERNNTTDMDSKLEKIFSLSNEALASGNEAKALAYLKKGVKLFPEEPEAGEKLQQLKDQIKAGNLVKIGLKKLSSGEVSKAIEASRKAFDLLPGAEGLEILLNRIEAEGENVSKQEQDPAGEAQLWADRIRTAVKDDRFEEAGEMVAEAVNRHPNDELLDSFYSKLKRLGFVKTS